MTEEVRTTDLTTEAGRRAALERADVSLRIEDLERDPASAPIFEQWARGEITEDEAIKKLVSLDVAGLQLGQ